MAEITPAKNNNIVIIEKFISKDNIFYNKNSNILFLTYVDVDGQVLFNENFQSDYLSKNNASNNCYIYLYIVGWLLIKQSKLSWYLSL